MLLMILYSLMAYRGNVYTEFLTVISEEKDYVLIYTFLPKQKRKITVWPSNTFISLKHKSHSTHSMVPPDFYLIAESNQSWQLQLIANEYKIHIIYSCKTWLN